MGVYAARVCALLSVSLALLVARPPAAVDPLQREGVAVTSGAAPGYVPDEVCADCHGGLASSYEHVSMSRSLRRPRPGEGPEGLAGARFEHAASLQRFWLEWRDGRLVFRRDQLAKDGGPINALELPVDFILGSGQHARTYLYRTPGGELYQLPLAFYAQERRFAMAPGYDRQDHDGVLRRVRRECLFCHNAYPDVPAGSDRKDAAHTFPATLPEGIGCQRCHGPGAEHVRAALGEPPDVLGARAAIVNPRRLTPERRDDVCFECHLQPAVELAGVRRLGRGDYSFRPGEALGDYLVQVEVDEADRSRSERFEINHHPYRLRQSRCYLASGRRLSCLTCHDPHKKPAEAERAAHYRAACLTCHAADACSRAAGAVEPEHGGDCAACHMPKRRTQDVVHVVMTDHLIRRTPGGPELIAPLAEREPALTGIALYEPERAPPGDEGELYRALAGLRGGASRAAEQRLELLLRRTPSPHAGPWLELGRAQLRQRRPKDAQATLRALLAREPGLPAARSLLAVALASDGQAPAALELLPAASEDPDDQYNRGRLLRAVGRLPEAEAALRVALRARSNFVAAHYQLGQVLEAAGRAKEALPAYARALELDPTHTDAYLAIGALLAAQGRSQEARRYLEHGAAVATRAEAVRQALARLDARGR